MDGQFGGAYIPEMLYPNVEELRQNYLSIMHEAAFQKEFNDLLKEYVGRPTPLYFAKRLSEKYNTKIYILVPGPLLKENWRQSLLDCTNEEYLKQDDILTVKNSNDNEKIKKNGINNALQYYKFMTYKSFYRKVLGEKISEKKLSGL